MGFNSRLKDLEAEDLSIKFPYEQASKLLQSLRAKQTPIFGEFLETAKEGFRRWAKCEARILTLESDLKAREGEIEILKKALMESEALR